MLERFPRQRVRLEKQVRAKKTIAAVLIGAAFLATPACTETQSAQSPQQPQETGNYYVYLTNKDTATLLPDGPCKTTVDVYGRTFVTPTECKNALESGRIAFIDFFGLSTEERKEFTELTQSYLTKATDGIIQSKLTVIDPSPEALRIFQEKTKDTGWTSPRSDHPETFLSVLAETTMPELRSEYDFVVALSSLPSLRNHHRGIADVKNDMRHADIFQDARDADKVAVNRAYVSIQEFASTTAHELLHLAGFWHAGKYTTDYYASLSHGESLDLGATRSIYVINNSTSIHPEYKEYGDINNIMGKFLSSKHTMPDTNPIQIDYLRQDIGDPYRDSVMISENQTSINYGDGRSQKYAIIPLNSFPIETNTLAILPQWEIDGSSIDTFKLYLFSLNSGYKNIYDIGTLSLNNHNNGSWQIVNNDQTIQISYNNGILSARTVA